MQRNYLKTQLQLTPESGTPLCNGLHGIHDTNLTGPLLPTTYSYPFGGYGGLYIWAVRLILAIPYTYVWS